MPVKNNILAYLTCLIILFLSMGYALFSDSLSIGATGIVESTNAVVFNEVILVNELPTLNQSEGLYSYNSKYYFSGENVNNYVMFNDELWRIVSIEEDGAVKIVKDEVVSIEKISMIEQQTSFWINNTNTSVRDNAIKNGRIIFDFKGKRQPKENETTDTYYCIPTSNGCNAYAIGTFLGKTVDEDSMIKNYLETHYFNSMTPTAQNQVQNFDMNIGVVETNKKIDVVLSSENTTKTNSYIGLLNVSDYVYASLDLTCQKSFDKEVCANSNWLLKSNYQFHLINGKYTTTNAQIWTVGTTGKITSQDANNPFYLRPVVVLNKNITAVGTGSYDDAYILGDIK